MCCCFFLKNYSILIQNPYNTTPHSILYLAFNMSSPSVVRLPRDSVSAVAVDAT